MLTAVNSAEIATVGRWIGVRAPIAWALRALRVLTVGALDVVRLYGIELVPRNSCAASIYSRERPVVLAERACNL